MTRDELRIHRQGHTRDNSWWLHDARGIPCCRVCHECRDAAEAEYRPEIFADPNYEANEPIEESD